MSPLRAPAGAEAPEPVNILLVDDQPAKLLTYEAILGELGQNLLKATTPREAFAKLLSTDVALVLMDVQMPELDGFELAAMIREHPRFERIAIIFVSAIHLTEFDRLKGYAAGAVDYLSVPIVPEVLRAKVGIFVELYRKTRALERMNAELETRVRDRTAELERLNDELERRIDERTREREAALAQLFEAQKNEAIGQLTGGVAHDFNNLLMAVMGSLELLMKRVQDPRALRLVQNAFEGAQRGATLTKRLLAFARRQELKLETVGIGALVAGMEDLLHRAVGPFVTIEVDLPDDLAPVRADPNQLELALLNLAVNARDAMPDGGTLRVSAQEITVAERTPDGVEPGPYLRITVADTGEGMDAATLARATEPFFTTKGPGKGTGLGLSMVHGVVAQSGGRMSLRSTPGTGTSIDLLLPTAAPMTPGDEVRSDPAVREPAQNAPEMKILLVDDDDLVRAGAVIMLEDLGHRVVEASSGEQALAALQQHDDIALLLTDHVMPGMRGLELIERTRKLRPGIGVILATGFADLQPKDAVADVHRLAKPFTQAELRRTLVMLTDNRRTAPQQRA